MNLSRPRIAQKTRATQAVHWLMLSVNYRLYPILRVFRFAFVELTQTATVRLTIPTQLKLVLDVLSALNAMPHFSLFGPHLKHSRFFSSLPTTIYLRQ